MGLLLIILGLASAAFVADLAMESASSSVGSITVAGASFHPSTTVLVLAAFAAGVLAVVLIALGASLVRRRRAQRAAFTRRLIDLERENEELRKGRQDVPTVAEPPGDALSEAWTASPASKR
jgi:hypothetical protein